MQDSIGIRKALVIGVSDYGNNLQSLDFCEKDGEEISKVLKSIGYEIPDSHKLVGQVKYETMKDRIYDFFTDTNTKSEDVLLFYYSGHGVPDVNGDVFLASSEINHEAPFRKGFSFYDLTNTIERSNSTRIVTILDCCYSGAAKISKGHEEDAARLGTVAIDDKSRKLQQQGEGKCLLAASMGYQEAYGLKEKGHSIFTYYLLEGFRGAKKAVDEEGNVTPDTLGKYVYREIINLPTEKRPKQKPIRKVEAGGDIILAQYPELIKKEPTQDPYESIQDATEFLKKGDYSSAVQYSDKALAINPSISVAYSIKGQALYSLKKYDEALVCYNKALELRPKYLEVLNYKAITLNDLGKYEEAIESLNQSTELNPNDAIIWNNKGLAFNQVGKYNDAIECFDKAIKLNPTYTEALKNEHTALSNLRQDRHDKQEQERKAQLQGQISSRFDGSSKGTEIKISTPKANDANIDTFDIAPKESTSDLATSKNIPSSVESTQENKREEGKLSKPKEEIQPMSPAFPSSTKNTNHPNTREVKVGPTIPGINRNGTSPSQQIPEKYDKRQGSAIGDSLKEDTDIYKPGRYISPSGGEEKRNVNIHPAIGERSQQKNLKIFIPIIIAGVVGSVIALAIFGTTTPPPETTPETTPTTPPDTTPETTPTTPPDTTPDTTQDKFGDTMTTFEEEAGGLLPKTTPTTPPDTTPTAPPDTTPDTTPTTPPETRTTEQQEQQYTFVRAWGSYGSDDGLFDFSVGADVAIDSSDKVYVADSYNDRIQVFDKYGTYLTSMGSYGSGVGELINATDVAIDSSGNVYVTDSGNNRIQKFDKYGTYLTSWGSLGSGNGQFDDPTSIDIDHLGNVYVTDSGNNRIQKFDSDGTYLTSWGSLGSGNGQFDNPGGVAVDDSDYVYVTDSGNNRIQKFDSDGTYLTSWGSLGTDKGQFNYPILGAVDSQGYVFVADSGNHRIEVFAPSS